MKLLFFATILFFSAEAFTDIAVIVHPTNNNVIEVSDLKNLYLGKKRTFPDGTPAITLSLQEGLESNSYFNQTVLEKSDSQLKAYWSKLIFTGKGTPSKQVSQDELINLVASNPNTIGYIDSSVVTDSVKVVNKF
ncbi:phosphate ABC transporter substrate-binding protein [Pseudoalteromonas tunicata]|uniref:phosphate ABC transporter substrate-binding protein n=1 Tax=Pseudoalteromonas tunicata TaxID=314281 RepID=UPI00273F4C84|nr:phosphate ABC transporter substrate-binding protein [Pseudoalteromonas tunicata]MDP5211602.1 phosphate ABC transporter substrate-binding protein [Pseudoalteromonas tunicata]